MTTTTEDLAAWCAQWQRRLRLQDWDVRIRAVERGSLVDPTSRGQLNWDLYHKTAHIAVVVSADLEATDPLYDPRRTVIHELLHIALIAWVVEDGSAEDTAQEQAINAIARAFVQQAGEQVPTVTK